MFRGFGKSLTASPWCFLERRLSAGLAQEARIDKKLYPVENTVGRHLQKSMIHNGATPRIEVVLKPTRCARRANADLRAGRGAAHGAALFQCSSALVLIESDKALDFLF